MRELVTIFEMGPRDGLQNEKAFVSTHDKITLVNLLSQTGIRKIEVTSFVSPRWVPQMADAADVLDGIERFSEITYSALTPNLRGFESALAAGANEVAVFASASEGFSRANINCSIEESLERFAPVLAAAKAAAIPVRGYVSCVTDCPFDGPTPPQAVEKVTSALATMGCYQVSLGDTIGHATPQSTGVMLEAVLKELPAGMLAGHFHDTKGAALANIETALQMGLRTFDAAAGGLGGCPFAPGSKGNVATGAVVDYLEAHGFSTGIDRQKLAKAEAFAISLRQ